AGRKGFHVFTYLRHRLVTRVGNPMHPMCIVICDPKPAWRLFSLGCALDSRQMRILTLERCYPIKEMMDDRAIHFPALRIGSHCLPVRGWTGSDPHQCQQP